MLFRSHGGRCIAGVSVDDGTEPRLLDVIEVELHYALPSDSHPEDWQIAPTRWHLVERPANATRRQKVIAAADKATTILRGYRDRMSEDEIKAKPLQASLALVCPDELHWWIREDRSKRKYRALFQRHHVTYDFAVTDPPWLDQLNLLPAGIYPHSTFADPSTETCLTISLSEAFFGWHYKLVAGVIVRAN